MPIRATSCPRLLSGAAALLILTGVGAAAQAPPGRTVWEGVFTETQAERGRVVFGQSCASCHSISSQESRPLAGEVFWEGYTQKTVGDLLTYVRTSMPNGNGNSLPASAYNDVVAAILKSNGLPAGSHELTPEAIANVLILPKDGSTELPSGALARIVGCLARRGNEWVLTNATAPERVEKSGIGAEDGTRALGGGTFALKFVVTRLDAFAGQRMSASGLLMGPGGRDGLNVTTVERVGDTCP